MKKDLFLTIGLFVAVCLFAAMFYAYVFSNRRVRYDSKRFDHRVEAFF
ncbi:MAG: hypothetical protein MZU97_05550 [Bacillus subtilis]|nr:hypothetical protein [Bacillus subtilis]